MSPPAAEDVYPCVPSSVGGMDPSEVAALIDQSTATATACWISTSSRALIAHYFGGNQAEIRPALNQYFGGGLTLPRRYHHDCEPDCPTSATILMAEATRADSHA